MTPDQAHERYCYNNGTSDRGYFAPYRGPLTDKQMQTYELLKTGISEKKAAKKLGLGIYALRSRAQLLNSKGWNV